MKLAIMQPYLFPYIDYFQLIQAVDKFIFYDDVNFIKQGWVNRNRILIAENIHYFTFPLKNASSFLPINQVKTITDSCNPWKSKLKKTLQQSYAKAPFFHLVYPMMEAIIDQDQELIAHFSINSVKAVCEYLNIKTEFRETSTIFNNNHLSSAARVLDICQQEACQTYINAIGGISLYSKEVFQEKNIELQFLQSKEVKYKQFTSSFHPWLSIIDILMHNSKEKIQEFLNEYQLV